MTLSRNEFSVLTTLFEHPALSQRKIAQASGLSVGSVNAAYKKLEADGCIQGENVTKQGIAELAPYKVDNAVILAAGLSTRFAPISYEKPKGLLSVRGEVLIERQIEQLKEVGIDEIIVVVGYKKEYFFYLEDKYGVKIVVNEEYASRNNNSSLFAAQRYLRNTYICSSDNYFTKNPYTPYMYKASYAAEFSEEATEEWCMQVGPLDRIVSVQIGGERAWYMIGYAYFDKAFSETFVRILNDEYHLPNTADKLWEEIFSDHIDQFDMIIKKHEPGIIYEFDSLDELREFDPQFLDNVDSEAFNNIVATLGCARNDICDIYPLKQGLTNLSCHFRVGDEEYVYRHPGIGTERLIDRRAETAAQGLAKQMGLDDTFIFEDAERGWKISKFIPDCRQLDPHDDDELKQAMEMARRLHATDASLDRTFDFYEESKRYEAILLENGRIDVPDYNDMAADMDKLHAFIANDESHTCLTHNDFFYLNLLYDTEGAIYLIDWEYAGMADYANDFGTFTVTCELTEDEALRALTHYFGRTPTPEEIRHNFAFVAFAGWCWYVWSLVKEAEGAYVGEWLYIYYNYAKQFSKLALKLYKGTE